MAEIDGAFYDRDSMVLVGHSVKKPLKIKKYEDHSLVQTSNAMLINSEDEEK